MTRRFQILACFIVAALGCGQADEQTESESRPVTVFAAASLIGPLEEIAAAFEQGRHVPVSISLGGSATLAQQIENGAPADLFISADPRWMDELLSSNLIAQSDPLLSNRLVVVAPADSSLTLDSLADLALPEFALIALADPAAAPAGAYARRALSAAGLWDQLQHRLIAAQDVRHALAYVERGEVDAGFVYRSDAAQSPSLKLLYEVPVSATGPIEYHAGLTSRGAVSGSATAFFEFLQSPAAADVFRRYGFHPPGETEVTASSPHATPASAVAPPAD